LYIEGRIRSREYVDKENNKKYVTEIIADQLLLLDPKKKGIEAMEQERVNEDLPF